MSTSRALSNSLNSTDTTTAGNNSVDKDSINKLCIALLISLSLHAIFMTFITVQKPELPLKRFPVKLLQPTQTKQNILTPPIEKQRIVSPSQAEIVPTPPQTSNLSDQNRQTPVEQIKRGTGDPQITPSIPQSEPEIPQSKDILQKDSTKKTQVKNATPKQTEDKQTDSKHTDIKQEPILRLSTQNIPIARESQFNKTKSSNKTKNSASSTENDLNSSRVAALKNARPFNSIKQQNTNPFITQGVPDFLPDIPDGDITLLNAKADRFAVFVRRVALQVFGAIRKRNWQEIPIQELSKLRNFVTIHAIMSPKGEFISASIESSSGSHPFDLTVSNATQDGTWDQNPPPEAAASDGNIHFIFQARSWGRQNPNGVTQQRWLLMGTGLL